MKKIIIPGCPGSGKSTFARALQKQTGLPLFYLDRMNWNPDRTTVEKDVFLERLQEVLSREEWILDGNYGSTIELRLQACDTAFFLKFIRAYPIQSRPKVLELLTRYPAKEIHIFRDRSEADGFLETL
ncbi:MAG: adenylate kinase [Firmicutes bacterium]|nr:adenylate kinase [Bacillota bacterium]